MIQKLTDISDGKINKISDLILENPYWVCLVKDGRFAKLWYLHAIINETVDHPDSKLTELYFTHKRGGNLLYACEIGIGLSKREAAANYGKFKYEKNETFLDGFYKVT